MTIDIAALLETYEKIRPSFFSGFLTITGFLLTAHTFMVTHMKKEVYEQEWYTQRIDKLREVNDKHSYFGALKRFSRLLLCTLVMSLVTAVLQVTLGLVKDWRAAAICTGFAASTVILLATCIGILWMNLRDWFEQVEADANRKWSEKKKASK